ncbi:MAG TPA: flagellar biosynthesis anti-sigma factor FlgM [Syntrophomonadaceae bacterium]|nr:flagellar biosynthesis anti-sigma factor FlgM [Syntrophomonadaceae bacterium]HOQ10642.1 flagellar biosynthesis anti-sigma factor FlgM [Syntrophomonadaceae bacterium]HPU49820.1 flagellar biosynthesis anti-sigma factor FlgM [Syntrophomonadaceae bacterium]
MIISKAQVQNLLQVYARNKGVNRADLAPAARSIKKDALAISDESRIKQKAMQAIRQADDVRMEKVQELRERISAGTYTLTEGEVAEKMIERAIVDRQI